MKSKRELNAFELNSKLYLLLLSERGKRGINSLFGRTV